jgi:hypothetical protein
MRAVLLASRAALCTARLRARRGSASARVRASPATAAHRAMHAAAAADGAPKTLNAALHAGRAALAGRGPLTLVLGNEAADMDSIACAVAFAALLRACGDDGAVAFVGVPREDLRLRAEVAWLLERERVDVDAVVFADDAELGALKAAGRLRRVVLVGAGAIYPHAASTQQLTHSPRHRECRPQQTGRGGGERHRRRGGADRGPSRGRRDVRHRCARHPARRLLLNARGACSARAAAAVGALTRWSAAGGAHQPRGACAAGRRGAAHNAAGRRAAGHWQPDGHLGAFDRACGACRRC